MAGPILNEVIQISQYVLDANQLAINRIAYQVTAVTGTGATWTEIATIQSGVIAPALKALLANTATYRGLGVVSLSNPVFATNYSNNGTGVGTAGAVPLPKQTAGLVSTYTSLHGRRQRGRVYLPFPAATDNTADGVPTAGYATRVATWVALALAPFNVIGAGGNTGLAPCIWHRTTHNSDLITLNIIRSVWATQKRRSDYGRTNHSPI